MATELVERAGEVDMGDPEAEAPHEFPDVRLDRRFVMKRDGKDYILYAGLLDLLHQTSAGYFAIETRLEQVPTQDNGNVAICSARVQVFDPDQPDVVRRVATGIGDAHAANVNRLMASHLIRMAETRAKARALRDAVNVGMVSFEELGPQGADDADPVGSGASPRPLPHVAPRTASFPSPAGPRPVETIQIDGRTFTRPQVLSVYDDRLAEAQRVGLQLAPVGSQGGPPRRDAPLQELVDFSAALKRRLEARAGAARSAGK